MIALVVWLVNKDKPMPTSATDDRKSRAERTWKTWRFRVSVRAVMILILALAAWLGWIAHSAREQGEAVAAITRAGGHVIYDWGLWYPGQSEVGGLFRPKWLVHLIGVDSLSQVTGVSLDGCASDADLVQVGRLTRLERLSLTSSLITDAGLRHLRGMGTLRQLFLHASPITDEGLAHLNGLIRLQLLTLVDTKVTDAGLPYLRGMRSLQELDVPTAVTDSGIRGLQAGLPSVQIHRGLPYK